MVESRVDPLSENGMIPQGSISQEPKNTHLTTNTYLIKLGFAHSPRSLYMSTVQHHSRMDYQLCSRVV